MAKQDSPRTPLQADASHSAIGGRRLAIRCLPRTPVATADIEEWLERQLAEFRQHQRQATLRLSRLTQALPSTDIAIGWLIELELPRDQPIPARDHIAFMLRDLRLLGLQPTLLVPSTRLGARRPGVNRRRYEPVRSGAGESGSSPSSSILRAGGRTPAAR